MFCGSEPLVERAGGEQKDEAETARRPSHAATLDEPLDRFRDRSANQSRALTRAFRRAVAFIRRVRYTSSSRCGHSPHQVCIPLG
jgi:hypothetical protein